ncbi:predicted protein [Botrytis cinerea T4]|uniref:Uncharacterized protein n=1 Tax=Botryotinia fuckeliana (strain T4) TaxID=999810 RepID=G2XN88_BOTF4|nr:predicted protein [Botrytis cinerea T4]
MRSVEDWEGGLRFLTAFQAISHQSNVAIQRKGGRNPNH